MGMNDRQMAVWRVLSRHRHESVSGSKLVNFLKDEEGVSMTWQEAADIRYDLRHVPLGSEGEGPTVIVTVRDEQVEAEPERKRHWWEVWK